MERNETTEQDEDFDIFADADRTVIDWLEGLK